MALQSLAEIMAGAAPPLDPNDLNAGVTPPVTTPPPASSAGSSLISLADLAAGRSIQNPDGTWGLGPVPTPPPGSQPDIQHLSMYDELANTAKAFGLGGASGVEIAGALAEIIYPAMGEAIRQKGLTWEKYFQDSMDPQWQAAVNKSWLDFSSNSALADPRSWVAGIVQTLPYMVGTGGAGTVGKVALEGLVGLSEKAASKAAFTTAGGAAGAGEAAAGAGQVADQTGADEEHRLAAMRVAAPIGALAGAYFGHKVEGLVEGTGGKLLRRAGGETAAEAAAGGAEHTAATLPRRLVSGAVGEAVEEGGTQVGTEVGKSTELGQDFSLGNVAEAAFGGAILGSVAGAIVSAPSAHGAKTADQKLVELRDAETQAAQHELERIDAEKAAAEQNYNSIYGPAQPPAPHGPLEIQGPPEVQGPPPPQNFVQPRDPALGQKPPAVAVTPVEPDVAKQAAITTFASPIANERLRVLDDTVSAAKAAVNQAWIKAGSVDELPHAEKPMLPKDVQPLTKGQRVKAKVAYKTAVERYKSAVADRQAFIDKQNAVTPTVTEGTQLALLNLPQEEQVVSDPAVESAQATNLIDTLDKHFPEPGQDPAEEDLPILSAIDASVKRSQRAKAGAATRAANRAAKVIAANTGPNQNIQPSVPDAPVQAASTASPEMQALRNRIASKTKAKPTIAAEAALQTPMPVDAPPAEASAPVAAMPVQPGQQEPPPSTPSAPAEASGAGPQAPGGAAQTPPPGPVAEAVAPAPIPPSHPQRDVQSAQSTVQPPPVVPPVTGDVTTVSTKPKPLAKRTPLERLTSLLKKGPQDVDKVLALLQDAYGNMKSPNTVALVEKLRKAFPISKGRTSQPKVENRALSAGFQGLYDPKTDTIYVDLTQAEDPVHAILHETVHAATLAMARTKPKVASALFDLFNTAKENWVKLKWSPDISEIRGFQGIEEFIAEALTNSDFADKLDALTGGNPQSSAKSILERFKTRLGVMFNVNGDPRTNQLFPQLLEFIPDGTFLQDGNRQEILSQLDRLGMSAPTALFLSGARSMLRQNSVVQAVGRGGASGAVARNMLRYLAIDQIATSWGNIGASYANAAGVRVPLHDVINKYSETLGLRGGAAARLRAQAEQIVSVFKNASQGQNSKHLDDILIDARRWGLHPDLPAAHPLNAPKTGQGTLPGIPGYNALWLNLNQRWNDPKMTQQRKDAFRLVRANSTKMRDDHINRLMLNRLRLQQGEAVASRLEAFINDPARSKTETYAGIDVEWNPPPTVAELTTVMGTIGVPAAKRATTVASLSEVHEAVGKSQGPYIPQRRNGQYFSVVRSNPTKEVWTQARYEREITANQLGAGGTPGFGDLDIMSSKQLPNGNYAVQYRHIVVSAHDTEAQTIAKTAAISKTFNDRHIAIAAAHSKLKSDNTYQALGLKSTGVEALRNEVRAGLTTASGNTAAGDAAADEILKYYLEKLPDTSARKSSLAYKGIQGADRDMLHIYSSYVQGTSYTSAQMKYGHVLARLLTTDAKTDIDELHNAGMTKQANDLTALVNHLKDHDAAANALSTKEAFGIHGAAAKWWRYMPQLAGAWLLTGPGTMLTNSFQVWQVSLPYLGSRYGFVKTAAAITKAYMDVAWPGAKVVGREFGRFGKQIGKGEAIKAAVAGRPLPSIKDPTTPAFMHMVENLASKPDEQALISELANRKKIDFGLVADIQSLADKHGRVRSAIDYLSEAAFIMPQMLETMNRVVTALATYRMHLPLATAEVARDPQFVTATPAERAAEVTRRVTTVASNAIDQTQWNYAQENRPQLFQNEALRAALVFKTYPQNMLYSITRNILQSMNAKTPEEKKVARKFIAGMFVTTATSAGLLGILALDPFYAVALALTSMFTDDDDPEQALREAAQAFSEEFFGKKMNPGVLNTLLKGVPYGTGLADTSRMGMPTMFPLQELFRTINDPKAAFSDYTGVVGEAYMGAPGSIIGQMTTASGKLGKGDYLGAAAQMTPKAFGINDFFRAWAYHNQGAVDNRGYEFIKPNDMNYWDVIARAVGFETPEISEAKSKRRAFYAVSGKHNAERFGLIDDFVQAQTDKDYETRDATITKIKQWNHENPREAINRATLVASIKNRHRAQHFVSEYGVNAGTKGQRAIATDVEERYQ